MSRKKIVLSAGILGAVLILSGCGNFSPSENMEGGSMSETKEVPMPTAEKLPTPTGDIDDAVDAAIMAADAENVEASADEEDALFSIDDSGETDDFGQAYDENEF